MNENIPSDIINKIQTKYDWMKQRGYYVGDPVGPGIYRTIDGGWQCNYGGCCAIVIRPGETEPHEIHGAIGQRWYGEWGAFDISGKRGSLGHPISDEEGYESDGDPNDRISHFENGDIIWTAKTDTTRLANIKDRARWYKTKHDQLLDLLRRAVEAPAPERHNEALKAVDEKCKEDQFEVVLLGEFQYGKSTTFDTLCGGRELSPQGEGTTPTSAVPVSIQSLARGETEEWGEIRFKSKREVAAEFFDTFGEELSRNDLNHPLKRFIADGDGSLRDRFCDGFDPDNSDHRAAVRNALEEAWRRFGENDESKFAFSTRQRQLMEVSTLIVRYYGTEEYSAMLDMAKCSVGEIGGFVWFPADWSEGASRGFDYDISFDDVRFAFVDKVILHIQAPFLEELGCRVTDCPGLDASAYDKEVTRRALLHADGVLFIHRCSKMVGASTLGTLFEFVHDTGRTSKTILALNLWGISRDKALLPHEDHRGREKPPIVGESESQIRKDGYKTMPVVWCHILLAYLSALGERRLRTGAPFTKDERRWLAEKCGTEDDGQSDESLWLSAVEETNSLFKVSGLKGVSSLDESTVAAVRKASNFDALIAAAKETVLREKTGSILVDNGSKKALETLRCHETELQLIEERAEKNEKDCAKEVESARLDLDEYDSEADYLIHQSIFVRFKDKLIGSLSKEFVNSTLSEEFFDGLSRRIGRIIHDLNKGLVGIFRSNFEKRFRSETGPLVIDFYLSRAIETLGKWKETPHSSWTDYQSAKNDLDNGIQELGSKRFDGKRLFKNVPIPALPKELPGDGLTEKLMNNLHVLDAIAEDLRDGFWRGLWDAFTFLLGRKLLELLLSRKDEEKTIEKLANRVRPALKNAFDSQEVHYVLEHGAFPVFECIHNQTLASLTATRINYRKKIQDRCDDLIAAHQVSDAELRRIAEKNRKLREECIAPLRAEIEAFELTVKTALQ